MQGTHTEAKRRLLEHLKRSGPTTAGAIAESFELTEVAVRQHLQGLHENGLVEQARGMPSGRGRPSTLWSLTEKSMSLFPDRNGELVVSLLGASKKTFGSKGTEKLLRERARHQVEAYRSQVPSTDQPIGSRVRALAKLRTGEGYMAEAVPHDDGSWLLIEHHCPICEAATECPGLCNSELEVFRETLGPGCVVERTAHILEGSDRCVYIISKSE